MKNSNESLWKSPRSCKQIRKTSGLVKKQVKMCKKYLEAMPHVVEASKLVVQTCEDAFKVTRWNCSTINLAPEYLSDLTRGKVKKLYTKEIPIHLLNPACHPPGKLLDMED